MLDLLGALVLVLRAERGQPGTLTGDSVDRGIPGLHVKWWLGVGDGTHPDWFGGLILENPPRSASSASRSRSPRKGNK